MKTIAQPKTEAQIKAKIRQTLFPKGISCPKCHRRYSSKVNDRFFCKNCRLKFSLKRCTPFAHSKLSYEQLWQLLRCWLNELSFEDTEAMMELSHVTVRRWYRRFGALIPQERVRLKDIVETDEAFIGRQRHHNQQIVVGGIERHSGQAALRPIPDREQNTLDRFLLWHVKRGSLVCTDAWSGYENIAEFFGYEHEVVNHSMGHFGSTNLIENLWMRLRRFIRKVYHHVWKEHLPRLLKEFQARNNHREAFVSPTSFLSYVFQLS